jgi:hypothetical protein
MARQNLNSIFLLCCQFSQPTRILVVGSLSTFHHTDMCIMTGAFYFLLSDEKKDQMRSKSAT